MVPPVALHDVVTHCETINEALQLESQGAAFFAKSVALFFDHKFREEHLNPGLEVHEIEW